MMKLIIASRNFASAPNTVLLNLTKWAKMEILSKFFKSIPARFFGYYAKLELLL